MPDILHSFMHWHAADGTPEPADGLKLLVPDPGSIAASCFHRTARVCSHCDAIICNACREQIDMRDDIAIQTVGYFCSMHRADGIEGKLERGVFIAPRRELR